MNAASHSPSLISRVGASPGCISFWPTFPNLGAGPGIPNVTQPGLAPKRLICVGSLGKTNPLNDYDLAEFVKLQKTFADSEKSWTVDVKDIDPTRIDLSVKNPKGGDEVVHRSPQEIMDEIALLDSESAEALATIRGLL